MGNPILAIIKRKFHLFVIGLLAAFVVVILGYDLIGTLLFAILVAIFLEFFRGMAGL